jgi:outer membrane protein OmpA-like peptidoglycan-associated protein
MDMYRVLPLILLVLLFSGCCQRTTLILLPDDTGVAGAATLKTEQGQMVVNTAYTKTSVGAGTLPTPATPITPEEVQKKYGKLLAAQPRSPESFILYFETGGTNLTVESRAMLPVVVQAVQQDAPVEVSIIGHSDTQGNANYNYALSLERAEIVHRLLFEMAPFIERVSVMSHGEKDQLVPTADEVSEPRNRRVEIMIR